MAITKRKQRPPKRMSSATWNAKNSPNQACRFWPDAREGEGIPGVTWSEAFDFGGHTPSVVVKDRGRVRLIALTHVEVVTP